LILDNSRRIKGGVWFIPEGEGNLPKQTHKVSGGVMGRPVHRKRKGGKELNGHRPTYTDGEERGSWDTLIPHKVGSERRSKCLDVNLVWGQA